MSAGKNDKEKKSGSDVSEFLAGPRRKRKSYVLMALGSGFEPELAGAMEGFIRTQYPSLSVALPQNAQDFRKQFIRSISLVVADDQFVPLDDLLELMTAIKQRRNEEPPPVLFLTRQPDVLVKAYHEKMMAFHEADEFLSYPGLPNGEVFARIKTGLELKNRRKSRRYKVDIPLSYFHLNKNSVLSGNLLDLSVHGGLIKASDQTIYKLGDQLKLSVPIGRYLGPADGDFLKISAKVRRVFISGDSAGISFEYVSDRQMQILTKFVLTMVNQQSSRRNGSGPAKRR